MLLLLLVLLLRLATAPTARRLRRLALGGLLAFAWLAFAGLPFLTRLLSLFGGLLRIGPLPATALLAFALRLAFVRLLPFGLGRILVFGLPLFSRLTLLRGLASIGRLTLVRRLALFRRLTFRGRLFAARIRVFARDLLVKLAAELLQLRQCAAERLGLVAQDFFGSLFDALAEIRDALAGGLLDLLGLLIEAPSQVLAGRLEPLVQPLPPRFLMRFVK